jgi:CubicO group peptidase (beta-lactamase class C family)
MLDALFGANISNRAPGAAVLVAQNGKVLFKKGYGLADAAHAIPITPQTQFRIGSITKQFTAAAILKLEEEGKLSIADKLSKYFPDFPRGDEVTLRHLLTHTSGIPDKINNAAAPDKLSEPFRNVPYDFDPGTDWRYDNSGYSLLGRIIEKVSGESYGDVLRREFFKPLGMASTGVPRSGAAVKHLALGYQFEGGNFTNAPAWDLSWFLGSGNIYSTVEDLCRWNEGVFANKVLGAASLKAALTPVRTAKNKEDGSNTGYGYGWELSRFRGDQEISHGGGVPGFTSFLLRLPRENFTVVVLANSRPGSPAADPASLAHLVAEVYLGQKLAPRPSYKVDRGVSAESFDALVGRYDYGAAILTVTREGDHLFAQLGPQAKCEIFATSATEFFWKAVDAQVEFVKDEKGKVIKAVHHQGGQTTEAPKLSD